MNVHHCARCGEDHTGLDFKEFVEPIVDDDVIQTTWTHWATCPVTGDPILQRNC